MLSYLTATKERSVLSYSLLQGLILAIFFLTAAPAQAGTEEAIRTKTICVEKPGTTDKYAFLLAWSESGTWRPPSVVQMFEAGDGATRPPQPIKCKL